MNPKFIVVALLLICALQVAKPSFAAQAQFIDGAVALVEPSLKGDIKITIRATPANNLLYSHPFVWGGDEQHTPHSLTTTLLVQVGNEIIPIPLSAYADLGRSTTSNAKDHQKGSIEFRVG